MLLEELREHYGTYVKMNRNLDLGNTTYLAWLKNGYIPYPTQCVIEKKTNKKFRADIDHAGPQK